MEEHKLDKLISLLEDIKANQEIALEKQAQQLEISQQLMANSNQQFEKAGKIQDRAETLQKGLGKFLIAFIIIVVLLFLIQVM